MFNLKYFKYYEQKYEIPSFPRPKIVGYFSTYGREKEYASDSSKLNYLHQPSIKENVSFDLNSGKEFTINTGSLQKKIDHTLLWVKENADKIKTDSDDKWIQPDFICCRGVLTSIMKSEYHYKEPWTIIAAKYKGTIYLTKAPKESLDYHNMNEEQKKFQEWGLKFPTFLVTSDPADTPDPSAPSDENDTFSCIFKNTLNNKTLLYEAMVDGVISNKKLHDPLPLNELELIELKTSKPIQINNYTKKNKFLNTWVACYLVGISKIIFGFRNDDGIVHQIKEYKTSQIKNDCKDQWKGETCLNLLDQVLDFIKNEVKEDHDVQIYKFERVQFKDHIYVSQLKPEESFLPKWFTSSK